MSSMANESFKEDREMRQEHHSGPGRYLAVWAALMVFTVITVYTGHMHLAHGALALALIIASVKGALVALFFMHLAEHKGANRLVFASAMLFVVLLLSFTLFDFGTRFRPALSSDATPENFPVDLNQPGRSGGMMKAPGTHP